MKAMLTIIGIICLVSSCRPQFKKEVKRVWSWKFYQCRCQFFDLNNVQSEGKLVPCEDFFEKNYPDLEILPNEEYCNDMIGVSDEAWFKRIIPKAKELVRWSQDNCK